MSDTEWRISMVHHASTEINPTIHCYNEYDNLKHVVVVSPDYMQIKEVINQTQRHYLEENINIDKAMEQHQQFVQTLESQGTNVIKLVPKEELNEQVFTRDIGFTIGNQFYLSTMEKEIRKPEVNVLRDWLEARKLPYNKIEGHSIEGGDVLIDNSIVWLGSSSRTSKKAMGILQKSLPDFEIKPIKFKDELLHLDCVFNIISEDTALIASSGVDPESVALLREHYDLIDVNEDEQFKMGTNVLSIGNKRVIALPENKRINNELAKRGYKILEVEFSEIIKSGGSFRCCSLPLERESN